MKNNILFIIAVIFINIILFIFLLPHKKSVDVNVNKTETHIEEIVKNDNINYNDIFIENDPQPIVSNSLNNIFNIIAEETKVEPQDKYIVSNELQEELTTTPITTVQIPVSSATCTNGNCTQGNSNSGFRPFRRLFGR